VPSRHETVGAGGSSLSLGQAMMLQGVIPIVLVGVLLPVGLIACFLALENGSVRGAVEHGELFLAAGNSAFTGCVVLVASRTDQVLNATIASLVVLVLIVLPAYACWGLLTVQELLDKHYSTSLATVGGGSFAVLAIVVALVFVWLSHRPPSL
jgi:hypothetical protein